MSNKIRENWIRFKARWQLQWYDCKEKYGDMWRWIGEKTAMPFLILLLVVAVLMLFGFFSTLIGGSILGYLKDGKKHIPDDKIYECFVVGAKFLGKIIGGMMGTVLAIRFLPVALCTAWHLWRKKS